MDFMQISIAQLVKWFEQQSQKGTFPYVSMDVGSFVMSDTDTERTLLYMGYRPWQGTLQTLGPLQARVLSGTVELNAVRCESVQSHAMLHYQSIGAVEQHRYMAGDRFGVDVWQAVDFSCSQDSLLLVQFVKSAQYRHHLCFDTLSLQLTRVSLRSRDDARLFNFIEVLARSSSPRCAALLERLTRSTVPEIAWRALEGISATAPQRAMALLQQYANSHPSSLISQRAQALLHPSLGIN